MYSDSGANAFDADIVRNVLVNPAQDPCFPSTITRSLDRWGRDLGAQLCDLADQKLSAVPEPDDR
jgi:hypothetical protein